MGITYRNSDNRFATAVPTAQVVGASGREALSRNIALLAVLLALAAALVVSGCGNETNDAQGAATEGRAIRIETMVLTPTPFEEVIQITGNVSAVDDAVLSAQASGTIISLVPLGTAVRAGQVVAQLDPSVARAAVEQFQAQVDAAEAQFALAEDNLQRNEPLVRDSIISAIEWENVRAQYNQARATLSQARAALSQAQEQLRHTRVTAPFAGTVETHFAELGEQVSPGQQVARVINTSRVKVVAGVPERYAGDITLGTPVRIEFRAYAGQTIESEVSFVGRAIDPQSRTFPVEVAIPNPDGTVKPEMVAQVFVTRRRIDDALVVPRSAVVRDEESMSVFLVEDQGDHKVAVKRAVLLGPSYGGEVVITNLQPGDKVVVLGQNSLTDGDRVQVMEQHASAEAAEEALGPEQVNADQEALPAPESE